MPLSINKPNAAPPGSSRSSRDMPVIVVKFTNRNVRDRLYRAKSNLKNFTVGDIGLGPFGDGKIFIQESLTTRRRMLFKQCLEIRKKFNYRFFWKYPVQLCDWSRDRRHKPPNLQTIKPSTLVMMVVRLVCYWIVIQ